jgi:L-arabinose isomerase
MFCDYGSKKNIQVVKVGVWGKNTNEVSTVHCTLAAFKSPFGEEINTIEIRI